MAKLFVAQAFRLVDEDFGQFGMFWDIEFDGWGDVFFLGLFGFLVELPFDVLGRAVFKIVFVVSDLYVFVAIPLFGSDLLANAFDLFFLVTALDSELIAFQLYLSAF